MKKKSLSEVSLLQHLAEKYKGVYSGKQIKKAIDKGFCLVNGRMEKFASVRIGEKDIISFCEEGISAVEQGGLLETVFEDEWLSVFNKPSGMDVEKLAQHGLLVHRLDKPTSGLIVVAKTEEIKTALEDLFRERKVIKQYVALVNGVIRDSVGNVEARIGIGQQVKGQKIMKTGVGKEAVTNWKVLKRYDRQTLVLLTPITGRTHQLRVHMASIGHPIVGDHQYGRREASRLLLHAEKLAFQHPKTGKRLSFQVKKAFV
jgi:23S rRNA-/tRNA-specific pseudouridylate synthase